jgi:hypothetical protein
MEDAGCGQAGRQERPRGSPYRKSPRGPEFLNSWAAMTSEPNANDRAFRGWPPSPISTSLCVSRGFQTSQGAGRRSFFTVHLPSLQVIGSLSTVAARWNAARFPHAWEGKQISAFQPCVTFAPRHRPPSLRPRITGADSAGRGDSVILRGLRSGFAVFS